ncbi:hypothetical protein K7J31_002906 [Vibrio parahaemolyticus]|nr:hypothetical protein [Vibrio parahaemolyticus]
MLLKKSKINFLNGLKSKMIENLPDELNLMSGDKFESYFLENAKSLVRTGAYLDNLADKINENYNNDMSLNESIDKVMKNADVASLVFQDLNLGNGRIVPVKDIAYQGGLTDIEQFNFEQFDKVLNDDEIQKLAHMDRESNDYEITIREMFKRRFDSLNDSLMLNESFRELMSDYALAKKSDVVELSQMDRIVHGCSHITSLEDSVYKINGSDFEKIDIVEAMEADLLKHETNDLKFDIISNVDMPSKNIVNIECLLDDGEEALFANIKFDKRDIDFEFDSIFEKLNLSTEDMLELQDMIVANVNSHFGNVHKSELHKYKIVDPNIAFPLSKTKMNEVGSLFTYSERHQEIKELYTDLEGNKKVYSFDEIHPMYFEKMLKAFDFETQKVGNQLAVKNKDSNEISFYQLNQSNRTELEKSEVSLELKEKVSENWDIELRNNHQLKSKRRSIFRY